MAKPTKLLLFELERHCNNYFNPHNDPDSPVRKYPPSFLELAARIDEYTKTIEKSNLESIRVDDVGLVFSRNIEDMSWQKAFARELSIYKRAKFI